MAWFYKTKTCTWLDILYDYIEFLEQLCCVYCFKLVRACVWPLKLSFSSSILYTFVKSTDMLSFFLLALGYGPSCCFILFSLLLRIFFVSTQLLLCCFFGMYIKGNKKWRSWRAERTRFWYFWDCVSWKMEGNRCCH